MKSREFQKLVALFKLDLWDITLIQTIKMPDFADNGDFAAVSFDTIKRNARLWAPNNKDQRSNVIHELMHLMLEDAGLDGNTLGGHRVVYALENILVKSLLGSGEK